MRTDNDYLEYIISDNADFEDYSHGVYIVFNNNGSRCRVLQRCTFGELHLFKPNFMVSRIGDWKAHTFNNPYSVLEVLNRYVISRRGV